MRNIPFFAGAIILCAAALAKADDYYECISSEGFAEYSIYPCEDGQLQTHVGSKETPKAVARKKLHPAQPAVSRPDPKPAGEGKSANDYNLANYKCVGKSGNILYTDARDYLAFETHRCKQISLSDACGEMLILKAKDPLAVVANKLNCP